MSEQPQIISIDNIPYLIDDLSDLCKEQLNLAQAGSQALGQNQAEGKLLQLGLDVALSEAKKLLPEPYQAEAAEEAGEDVEVVDNRH